MIGFKERCAGLAAEIGGVFKSMLKVGASFVTSKKMHGKREAFCGIYNANVA